MDSWLDSQPTHHISQGFGFGDIEPEKNTKILPRVPFFGKGICKETFNVQNTASSICDSIAFANHLIEQIRAVICKNGANASEGESSFSLIGSSTVPFGFGEDDDDKFQISIFSGQKDSDGIPLYFIIEPQHLAGTPPLLAMARMRRAEYTWFIEKIKNVISGGYEHTYLPPIPMLKGKAAFNVDNPCDTRKSSLVFVQSLKEKIGEVLLGMNVSIKDGDRYCVVGSVETTTAFHATICQEGDSPRDTLQFEIGIYAGDNARVPSSFVIDSTRWKGNYTVFYTCVAAVREALLVS